MRLSSSVAAAEDNLSVEPQPRCGPNSEVSFLTARNDNTLSVVCFRHHLRGSDQPGGGGCCFARANLKPHAPSTFAS